MTSQPLTHWKETDIKQNNKNSICASSKTSQVNVNIMCKKTGRKLAPPTPCDCVNSDKIIKEHNKLDQYKSFIPTQLQTH